MNRIPAAPLAISVALGIVSAATASGVSDTAAAFGAVPVPAMRVAAAMAAAQDAAEAPPSPLNALRALPADCRFEIPDGAYRGTWFGRTCLVATFDHWPLLPDLCEVQVDGPWYRPGIIAYDPTCLAQFGYWPDDWEPWPPE